MTANPILVEVKRGPLVESRHGGTLALVRADGKTVLALGDVARPVYPRSAVKAFQAIPLIETGAADAFGFGLPEIALAIASHSGTERHAGLALKMLERAGLGDADLECGAHTPLGEQAAVDFHRAGRTKHQVHNNCSGKHAGMLATCRHCGEATAGYTHPDHPHQKRIRAMLEAFTGETLGPDRTGVDGCSAPNFAISVGGLAKAFAELGSGEGAARSRRAVTERIIAAGFAEPELVAGQGRLDTRVMSALPGKVFTKTGAEGVYCGALPEHGLGFAIKIDDGAGRAAEMVTGALIAALLKDAEPFGLPTVMRNWRGIEVGRVEPSPALRDTLAALGRR